MERSNDPIAESNKRTRDAVDWFQNKLKALAGVKGGDEGVVSSIRQFPKEMNRSFMTQKMHPRSVGRMFMFSYDPKTKDKLPYYDTLPLILLVSYEKDGFFGLNLHYVHPMVRMKIIQMLQKNLNMDPVMSDFLSRNEKSKIEMNYSILRDAYKMELLKPCFKKYLFSHVRSSFLYVDPAEWEKSVMLPTEKFVKATKQRVWQESMHTPGSGGTVKNNKPVSESQVRTTDFFKE